MTLTSLNGSFTDTMDVEPIRRTASSHSCIPTILTSRAWAWEFLRRNPAFKRDWRSFRIEPTTDTVTKIDSGHHRRYLEKWGLVFR